MKPLNRFQPGSGVLAAFISIAICAAPAHASAIYHVSVDTSGISGTAGNLDFQFDPGGSSQAATLSVTSFSSVGGAIGGAAVTAGDVAGSIASTLTINNTSAFNDYFQPFTYGTSLQFQIQFSGPAVTSPNGTSSDASVFGFSLFDADGANTFLTTNPDGFAGTATLNLNGTTTTAVFPRSGSDIRPVVTFSSVTTAPEPGSIVLIGLPLLALAGSVLRKKIQA